MRPNIPPDQFADWLKKLPPEERERGNAIEEQRARQEYEKFQKSFNEGMCCYCGNSLKVFSATKPCLHWLLRPNGLKKKMMPSFFERFNYFRLSCYIRWVASLGGIAKNINDIRQEHPGENIIDFTAKHKHIAWSIHCSKSDFEGHAGSKYGKMPHYHMQIMLSGRPFIDYGDFHIEFHESDLYDFELIFNNPDIVRHSYGYGVGMNGFFEHEETMRYMAENSIPTENEEEAAFNIETIVSAQDGKTISGDIVYEAIQEAKATGRTIASVLKEKLPDENFTTVVSPGPGVPQAMQRTKTKR